MASPNAAADDEDHATIDSARPLRDIIVCCTSIPPEHRTSLAQKVEELGGIHKYDLTPDVTHLVVGDYDTPKYRHVARERPDIKAMDAAWVDALTELWKNDDEYDFRKLELDYTLKPLEKRGINPTAQTGDPATREPLLICLTGFGDQRDDISQKIMANGGLYTGDLTRKCTHLIVNKAEGKKFTAAKSWGIYAVSLDWLNQTLQRGLILDEAKFDPLLPLEEQGKGAWIKKDPRLAVAGKRTRSAVTTSADSGPRKLRKTASMKLSSQRNNIWGDILGRSTSREYSFAHEHQPEVKGESKASPAPTTAPTTAPAAAQVPMPVPTPIVAPHEVGVFSNCCFYIHGFNEQRTSVLQQTIATLDGIISSSLEEAATLPLPREPSYRFLLVPQTSHPDTHPEIRHENISAITEYYIENCLHNKQFFSPNELVLGRPFPLFPIPGFSDLTVCSAAFTGIELNQVSRSVAQLGANFEEEFRKSTSVLVCKSIAGTRKEKLRLAIKWGVPAVSADWLWECISTGYKVPITDFIFPELKNLYLPKNAAPQPPRPNKEAFQRTYSEPVSRSSNPRPPVQTGVDTTGFDQDSPDKPKQRLEKDAVRHTNISAEFATARTHLGDSFTRESEAPLAEVSSTRLNNPPSPEKRSMARTRSEPSKKLKAEAPEIENTHEPRPLSEAQADLPQQRDEEGRQQDKAAERQTLSSKLTSLIDAPPDTHAGASHAASVAPRPRRRQIFGRALSNASNTSSASASLDAVAKPAPESFHLNDDDHDEQRRADDSVPPTTQLEYQDPEAQEYKAAVMSRMMGGSGEVKSVSSAGMTPVPLVGGRTMRRR